MAMHMDRQADGCTHRLDQFGGRIRRQQTGHILDADGVATHCFQFAGQFDKLGDAVHRAGG